MRSRAAADELDIWKISVRTADPQERMRRRQVWVGTDCGEVSVLACESPGVTTMDGGMHRFWDRGLPPRGYKLRTRGRVSRLWSALWWGGQLVSASRSVRAPG